MVLTIVDRRRHALDLFSRRAAGHAPRDRGSEQYDVDNGLRLVLLERERAVRHQVENVLLEAGVLIEDPDLAAGLEVRGQGAVGEVGRADERARRASSAKCWP